MFSLTRRMKKYVVFLWIQHPFQPVCRSNVQFSAEADAESRYYRSRSTRTRLLPTVARFSGRFAGLFDRAFALLRRCLHANVVACMKRELCNYSTNQCKLKNDQNFGEWLPHLHVIYHRYQTCSIQSILASATTIIMYHSVWHQQNGLYSHKHVSSHD